MGEVDVEEEVVMVGVVGKGELVGGVGGVVVVVVEGDEVVGGVVGVVEMEVGEGREDGMEEGWGCRRFGVGGEELVGRGRV